MQERLQVGDIVECVDARPDFGKRWRARQAPVKGALYTVVELGATRKGHPGCALRELGDYRYRQRRFRLVHRPRSAFLAELLEAAAPAEAA